MGPAVISQLATGLGLLAGALMARSMMEKPMTGGWPRCPRCNGTGRVGCMCLRWSDNDVGCRTCGGSGKMLCSACGGSGTGRPLPVSAIQPRKPSGSS